jgi:hypothetical protein
MRPYTARRLGVVLVLLGVIAAGVAAVAASDPGGTKTHPLHGQMQDIHNTHNPSATPPASNFGPPDAGCQSTSGVCSRFEAQGDIRGDGLVFIDTFPSQDSPSYSKAHTVITTKNGSQLMCHEAALFDLAGADHAFVDECIIDGGTGDYAGATGYIQEVGTFDFANNVGQLDYYGKLTLPDNHDHGRRDG